MVIDAMHLGICSPYACVTLSLVNKRLISLGLEKIYNDENINLILLNHYFLDTILIFANVAYVLFIFLHAFLFGLGWLGWTFLAISEYVGYCKL